MNDDLNMYQQDRALRTSPFDEPAFARAFAHDVLRVNDDVRIHYAAGGAGPVIVLLHGFPQHSREWRWVMPALADAGYTVIAPDLRGFGRSDRPLSGFDVATVAEDIRALIGQLGHTQIDLVGHDLGAAVAYAWAAAHPQDVRRLVLMEAIPAGLEPATFAAPSLRKKPTWHLAFAGTPDVPEALLAGREAVFASYLFRSGSFDQTTFSDDDIASYVEPFAAPGGVRAALAHIRAMPQSADVNRRLAERKLSMPVLTVGTRLTFGNSIETAAQSFADSVTGVVAERSGHWIPEERPVWLAHQISGFLQA
jgi:pimeloyl-ACP methyl ester carboxylesterase